MDNIQKSINQKEVLGWGEFMSSDKITIALINSITVMLIMLFILVVIAVLLF